jgi:hypothetical protein
LQPGDKILKVQLLDAVHFSISFCLRSVIKGDTFISPSKLAHVVGLLICVWVILSSNFSQDTDYFDWRLSFCVFPESACTFRDSVRLVSNQQLPHVCQFIIH